MKDIKIKLLNFRFKEYFNIKYFLTILRNAIYQSIVEGTFATYTIFMLILIGIFSIKALKFSNVNDSGSHVDVVLVIGLSQSIFAFILGTVSSVGTSASTLFARNLNSSQEIKNKIVFNSLFVLFFVMIFIILLVSLLGKYIIFLQDININNDIKNLITHFVFYLVGIIPACAIFYYASNILAAENHGRTSALIIGVISPIMFFVISISLFYGNAYDVFHSNNQIIYENRIVKVFGTSLLISFYTCLLGMIFFYYSLVIRKKTKIHISPKIKHYLDKSYIISIIQIIFSIFIRNFGIIILIYVAYIGMTLIPVPKNSFSNGSLVLDNSLYWQYVCSSFIPITTFVVCSSSGFARSNRFILSKIILKNDFKKLKTLLFTQIFTSYFVGLFISLILIILAPQLLYLFGIKNHGIFLIYKNGILRPYSILNMNKIGSIAFRIIMATIIFEFSTSFVVPQALVTHKIKMLFLAVLLRNILLYIPIFLLFCYISHITHIWELAWISYNVIDFIFLIISLWMIFIFYRIYKNTNNIVSLIKEKK